MPGVAVCAGVVAEEAGLFMVCLGTHWGLPPVLFALLALEIWAGRGPWSAKVRAGQVPGERSERLWGAAPSLWARSAAEAVALRGADRRPQSEGQKGKLRWVGGPAGAGESTAAPPGASAVDMHRPGSLG